jgi:uncharacterized protein (DUF4415 family)
MSGKNIVRFSAEALKSRIARGDDLTDRVRVLGKTDAELEADAKSDPAFADLPRNWYESADTLVSDPQPPASLRLDRDVVDWFKAQGHGYQGRMSAVLRSYMLHRQGKL